MATTHAPDHHDAIAGLARAGYSARGVVYLLVGGLAALAAFGQGGQTTGSRGALQTLLTAPFGKVMLGVIAVGLLGYAVWRCVQAIKDTDHHGTDAKALAIRGALLVSAVIHVLLAFFVATLIFTVLGSGQSGSGNGSEGAAQWLMEWPYGDVAVGLVGAAIVGAGIAHMIKGWRAEFDRHFSMPAQTQRWAYPICRFGLVIRGVVLVIVGGFFVYAGYQFDPSEAGGLGEVFTTVRGQPFGRTLLAVVALGLFAFGVYSVLEAIYRRL